MKIQFKLALLVGALAMVIGHDTARAASSMEELQGRFKQRYPQVRQYKDQGKIGETSEGMIAAVDAAALKDAAVATLVSEENADRTELYQLIAAKEKTTPQLVAQRNAARNFQRAKTGDWLRGPDGKWTRKG